jgi:hypothetical protein
MRPVPSHAVVPQDAIDEIESEFTNADDLEGRVDRAFGDLDDRQPTVARFIANEVDGVSDETAQALGHFLGVAVHEAFVAAFGTRMRRVDDEALEVARATFEVDEELRKSSPDEMLESDDVVAIAQPHVVSFVRAQLDAALEPDEDGEPPDVDLEDVSRIYRAVLVEIVALSSAVTPPTGVVATHLLA